MGFDCRCFIRSHGIILISSMLLAPLCLCSLQAMRIENGVYLGPLGALAFEGRFSMKNRILAFLFDKLKIKIGILPPFTINIGKKADEARVPGNSDPFFIWFYADDEIIVAKGRGGGLAYWCRCKRVAEKF